MKKNQIGSILFFLSLFGVGLWLLLIEVFTPNDFLIYFPIVGVFSVAIFFSDRIKSINLAGQKLEMFEQARDDIKEYLAEIYSSQLLGITSNEVLSIPIGKAKSIDFDHFVKIFEKTSKYELNKQLNPVLKQALVIVMERQEQLLCAYSQHTINEANVITPEERIAEYSGSARFSAAADLLSSSGTEYDKTTCRDLFQESSKNLQRLIQIQKELGSS